FRIFVRQRRFCFFFFFFRKRVGSTAVSTDIIIITTTTVVASFSQEVMFHTPVGGRSAGAFYCPSCNVYCSDSRTAALHRSSLKHKKKSGELEMERQLYKEDASVTVEDVMALVERKRVELGVVPWSQLRFTEEETHAD
ncbi:hypothetical protein TcCL_ESM12885, partial [Trypanosoma cruzi]